MRVGALTSVCISILAGAAYAEFETFPVVFNLADLNGKNGFTMNSNVYGSTGHSVSRIGDINGDEIDDILIGAAFDSYVVFGSEEPWPKVINLSSLNGTKGFLLYDLKKPTNANNGWSVSGAGDVNGDGIDDILIGAPSANNDAGHTCVVFGSKEPWPKVIDLSSLNGSNGFIINGIHPGDGSGYSVSGAGDVNGDGIDDVLIGASRANNDAGQSYVVFGSKEPWAAVIDLFTLNGTNGFILNGVSGQAFGGISVSGAGDVNGDGIDDIIIGSPLVVGNAGQSYIVFGSKEQWPAVINLIDLTGATGFAIDGVRDGDFSGYSVSGAGDVNGDGIDDVIIGAQSVNNRVSQSYVVFGSKKPWPAAISLAELNGNNGFIMNGRVYGDSGYSVSGAGDVDGDGIDDILIGAPLVGNKVGQSYVVFGSEEPWPAVINLTNLNGANGFFINGIHPDDYSGCSISGAGDVNGDGIDDILIGADGANSFIGQSYIIFGERK